VNIGGGDEEMVDDGEPCCRPPPAWPVATTMDSNTKVNIIVVVLKEVLFVLCALCRFSHPTHLRKSNQDAHLNPPSFFLVRDAVQTLKGRFVG